MRAAVLLMSVVSSVSGTLFTRDSESGGVKSPIILIPGDGGNQLEARVTGAGLCSGPECLQPECAEARDWFRLWLDVWQLRGSRLGCWADTIRLVYNRTSGMSSNVAGVETRVPGWGQTSSVEYLDPSWSAWVIGNAGSYMKDLVQHFVDLGYERGRTIRAAPYDFRLGPQSQGQYFDRLKRLVEDSFERSGRRRVTLISHSMGGLLSLYFLQQQTEDWKNRHINKFIPLNTPWRGAVIQLNTYASGYNLGIDLIDPLVIRHEQRSYETGVYIMPLLHTWNDQNEVLVQTPSMNYTVRDYPAFFRDIGFPQGLAMMETVRGLVRLSHPGVSTVCVASRGVPTPSKLVYSQVNSFPDAQPERIMGDGDGTVTLASLRSCRDFLNIGSEDAFYQFDDVNHGDVLKSKKVLKMIEQVL